MTTAGLRDRDIPYLDAFPLRSLWALSGPSIRPTAWDDQRGWYNPDPDGDYECWWAATTLGDVAVPPVLVAEAAKDSPSGRAWDVRFTSDSPEVRRVELEASFERTRCALNAAAQRAKDKIHA